jgi:hypothetical protein
MFWSYSTIYRPEHMTGASGNWVRANVSVTGAYFMAAVLAFIVNYRNLTDINERRRVRVLVLGTSIAVLANLPLPIISRVNGVPFDTLAAFFRSLPVQTVSLFLFLALPLAFAYAILHHRLFDIRVMIRQGLKHALARGVMVSLVPGLTVILIADLLLHADQPLIAVLRGRGWVYGSLALAALLAQSRRKDWAEALDRQFFREHYDAQKLLRDVVEEAHESSNFDRMATRVVARTEAALHSEFVALLVRNPSEPTYRSLDAAPAGQSPPPLLAESKLMSLIRVLGKPLDVSSAESG